MNAPRPQSLASDPAARDVGPLTTSSNEPLDRLSQTPFDDLPAEHKARAYGVDYARFVLAKGGELFFTRYGWGLANLTVPRAWFLDKRYRQAGRRLLGSTGTVYRVPVSAPHGATESLVIKFSRVAQDVPVFVDQSAADEAPWGMIDGATFNDPFEEFGMLMALRRGPFGPNRPRILTKKPLAIYSPPVRHALWQLGRKEDLFASHAARLAADQAAHGLGEPVKLELLRDYILVFQWVKGADAEEMHSRGLVSESEMRSLYFRSSKELKANGFMVLDHKPRHLILRFRRRGAGLVRQHGLLTYALVDFELMKRTEPGWRGNLVTGQQIKKSRPAQRAAFEAH